MIGLLVGAWIFCMIAFGLLGMACRVACRRRRVGARPCICGRHPAVPPRRIERALGTPGAVPGRSSRLRAAEARVKALQRRYVEGRLSIEQYESELDRVVGLA